MDPSSLNHADFRSHSSPEAALEASGELPSHRRRVRVAYERSKAVVLRAVPKGCRLARHVVAWKRAVLEHPALELMRADGRANMAALGLSQADYVGALIDRDYGLPNALDDRQNAEELPITKTA